MRIGLYFDSRHLPEWTWQEFLAAEVPLSGTDSQNLHLAHQLASYGQTVFFFSTQAPTLTFIEELKHIQVTDLKSAVIQAKKANIDILIFNNKANQETIIGVQQSQISKQVCVVWDQNGPSPKMADLLFCSEFIYRVVCVSASQADNLRDHPVFSKIEFIHNSLYSNFMKSDTFIKRNPLGVCYLGALTPSKGFQHLAKAWITVRKVFPDATLSVIGSPRLYNCNTKLGPLGVAELAFELSAIIPYLGNTIEELKAKGIVFFGLVKPKILHEIIASCSLGIVNPNCLTSQETFCVSAIDIQAAGTAVVGANRAGLRETVNNGVTGILINYEEELANTIIKLLSNPDKLGLMGKSGSEWVYVKFNTEIIIKRWLDLFNSVVENKKANPPAFCWKRANIRILIKECIRKSRNIPVIGSNIPTLNSIKTSLIRG